MRLKSSIFVSALLRQTAGRGGFATVLNKGSEEAGAIFVVHVKARGNNDLYGPAPQAFFEAGTQDERLFEPLLADADDVKISEAIERQQRFDSDCWIVEIELNGTLEFLPLAKDSGGNAGVI